MYVKLVRPKTRPSRVLGYRVVGKVSRETLCEIIGICKQYALWYSKGMHAWVRTLHDEDALQSLASCGVALRKAGWAVADGELDQWLTDVLNDPTSEYYKDALAFDARRRFVNPVQ